MGRLVILAIAVVVVLAIVGAIALKHPHERGRVLGLLATKKRPMVGRSVVMGFSLPSVRSVGAVQGCGDYSSLYPKFSP